MAMARGPKGSWCLMIGIVSHHKVGIIYIILLTFLAIMFNGCCIIILYCVASIIIQYRAGKLA